MSDDNRELKIRITGDASGIVEASHQSKEAVENLTQSTKDATKATEAATEAEKPAIASKRELRSMIGELHRELPALGELGRIALNPLVGGIVLFATAIRGALDGIKELGAQATPEFDTLTAAVEAQRNAMEEVDLAAQAYQRTIVRLSQATQSVSGAAQQQAGESRTASQNELAIMQAQHEKEHALLEEAEQAGLLTHQQYLVKRLAADEDYTKKRAALDKKAELDQINAKTAERDALEAEVGQLEKGLPGATGAARASAGQAAFRAGALTKDEKDLEETQKKIKELEDKGADLRDKTSFPGSLTTMTPQVILEQQKTQNEAQIAAEINTAAQLRTKIEQDKQQQETAKDSAATDNEDLQDRRARIRKDRERINAINQGLPAEYHSQTEADRQRAALDALHGDTARAGVEGAIGKELHEAGAEVQQYQAGGRLSAQSAQLIQSLAQLIDGHKDTLDEAVKTITKAVQSEASFKEAVKHEFQSIQGQMDTIHHLGSGG